MRNDDQLASDLGDAFRSATTDLTYSGRVPTPRVSPAIAVPAVVAGVAGVVGVAAVVASSGHSHHLAHNRAVAGTTTSASPTQSPAARHPQHVTLNTRQLTLAGYTILHTQSDVDVPIYGKFVAAVPDGATKVQTDGPSQDWIGTDPATGAITAYVDPPSGQVLAITSADATRDELVTLLQTDQPEAVPVVNGTNS